MMRAFLVKRLPLMAATTVMLSGLLPLSAANGVYQESIRTNLDQTTLVQTRLPLPARLKIPKIKVNAPIQSVGLTSAGAIGVPSGRSAVAWYKLGPRPGEPGSAVIVGHSGSKPGPATVFDNLPKLRKGDVFYVQDVKGKQTAFVVTQVRTYSPNAEVPEAFVTTGTHLNLITCIWNPSKRAFSTRFIVFSDLKT